MSLELGEGEVVALVGENGAGKTTLMNVLYGLYRADAGALEVGGAPVHFKGPADAIARGIGMVHQHFMLIPALSVAENVVLGREPTRFGLLDRARAVKEVRATCQRFGFELDPEAQVSGLSVGSQQKVEIVKALHRGARVLILDEPTAVLTPQEADELFKVVRGLAASGHTVVFISHKLREVLSVAERIVVMRRGRKVAEVRASDTNAQSLAELMVGAPSPQAGRGSGERGDPPSPPVPVLEVQSLSEPARAGVHVSDVTLQVAAGEIVGVAGVDGNGQRELVELLTGLRQTAAGRVDLGGTEVTHASPGERRAAGLGHVPEDRLLRAVVGPMTVEENLSLGRHRAPPFARGPWIDFAGRRQRAAQLLEDFDVRPRDPRLPVKDLSGGNQQKVVVARELDGDPKLLIVVQPTRGLDVAAVSQVHARLRAHAGRGRGVLLVSLDLEEVLALADRLYVMYGGQIVGALERAAYDERRIGRMMLGAQEEAARDAHPAA